MQCICLAANVTEQCTTAQYSTVFHQSALQCHTSTRACMLTHHCCVACILARWIKCNRTTKRCAQRIIAVGRLSVSLTLSYIALLGVFVLQYAIHIVVQSFDFFNRLQMAMTKVVQGVGGLEQRDWRSFRYFNLEFSHCTMIAQRQ